MARVLITLAFLSLIGGIDALVITKEKVSATSQLDLWHTNTAASARLKKMRAEAVKVIAEGYKRNIEDIKNGKASKMVAERRKHYSPKDLSKVLTNATNFLKQKRAQIAANRTHRKGTERCGPACVTGSLIDGFFLLAKMGHVTPCGPAIMLVWWVTGTVVFMVDQGLTFDEAVFVLGQEVTTIGYGSHCPKTAGMKMFHALHSVMSVLMVSDPTIAMIGTVVRPLLNPLFSRSSQRDTFAFYAKYAPLALSVLTSTFGFALDLHEARPSTYPKYADALLDSLYMTLFSLTTVGYGDISPMTSLGRLLGAPWMVWMTDIFSKSFSDQETLSGLNGAHNALECSELLKKKDKPEAAGGVVEAAGVQDALEKADGSGEEAVDAGPVQTASEGAPVNSLLKGEGDEEEEGK